MPRRLRPWLLLAVAALAPLPCPGCGGDEEKVDEGVVVPNEATPAPDAEGKPTPDAQSRAEGWGSLRGRVTFSGEAPTPKVLVEEGEEGVKDGAVCASHRIVDESLVVDPVTKGVRWALVYIPKPSKVKPEAERAARAEPVVFDQVGCVFTPHVLAVMEGNRVLVKSSDQAGHNVHTRLRNTPMNRGIEPGATLPVEIERADGRPAQVVCDVHPWMESWWLTLDNPYFAVTDEEGRFEIDGVPAGPQKVVVWNEAAGFLTPPTGSAVSIPAGGVATKDVAIGAADVKRLRK